MKNYTYDTVTGSVTIEVDEKWEEILKSEDAIEVNSKRKHTRSDHKYACGVPLSLESLLYEGNWLTDYKNRIELVELSIDMRRALKTLTVQQQRCFIEVLKNGRTQQSVSDELGIAQQNVDKHIKAARKNLKKYFQG